MSPSTQGVTEYTPTNPSHLAVLATSSDWGARSALPTYVAAHMRMRAAATRMQTAAMRMRAAAMRMRAATLCMRATPMRMRRPAAAHQQRLEALHARAQHAQLAIGCAAAGSDLGVLHHALPMGARLVWCHARHGVHLL